MFFGNQNNGSRSEKNAFVKAVSKNIGDIYDGIKALPEIPLLQLVVDNAALIIVDMINGFTKEGALASPNALAINETIAQLAKACEENGIPVAALADTHGTSSPEFGAFPVHCMAGTSESEITSEIAAACKAERIEKNSTNGFHEAAFREWLDKVDTDTFIIVGVCTDLCVMHLATSLKTWFNANNKLSRVVIPVNAVATYDGGTHDSALVNTMALYMMQTAGIELCSEIKY